MVAGLGMGRSNGGGELWVSLPLKVALNSPKAIVSPKVTRKSM